ncbi:MAG: DUF5658 family protein [Bryobacteraceae bacterium]
MDNRKGPVPQEIARSLQIHQKFPALPMALFLLLQILDVLTTLAGLHLGAREGSSFILRLLRTGPITGLLISKIIAAGLAAFAVFLNRKRMLVFLNIWFCAIVTWNLFAIWLLLRR